MLLPSCARDESEPVARNSRQPSDTPGVPVESLNSLTIFFTGSELGAMKPCGCSGGQLGGLDRRAALFNRVPENARLVVDTGSFVLGDTEQDLIKFSVILQACKLLGYDLLCLAKDDLKIASSLGLLDNLPTKFITPSAPQSMPARFTKRYIFQNKPLDVSVATFDPDATSLDQLASLFVGLPEAQSMNVLVLSRCDAAVVQFIRDKVPAVDCVVCPPESDEPLVLSQIEPRDTRYEIRDTSHEIRDTRYEHQGTSDPNRPLVFAIGRYGKYVCQLQITSAGSQTPPEPKTTSVGDHSGMFRLRFRTVPVTEDLPQADSLVQLYKSYQQILTGSGLLDKHPRFPMPGDATYVGSEACKTCHEYEYQHWSVKPHAQAYATLEKVGSQYDPECVVCHVVGMDYETGFVSSEKTPHLKDVGCENCHGPGSIRVRTACKVIPKEPVSHCTDCHTPEHSTNYSANEKEFLKKIIHWKEPNAAGDVK
jgi:hypothetical protein